MFFLKTSSFLFDNLRVVPLLASITLVIVSYFFTVQISSKRIAGLIAVGVILQSYVFLLFDTTATYSNFWVLFYIISLYLVKKGWPISSIMFLISVFAKPITLTYWPINVFYILRTSISKKKKLLTLSPYFLILAAAGIIFIKFAGSTYVDLETISFYPLKFLSAFAIFPYQFRFDFLIILLLIPVNILLYSKAKHGQQQAQSLQLLLGGLLFTGPLLTGFLDFVLNPYRLIPFIIFFAISFWYIFTKTSPIKN